MAVRLHNKTKVDGSGRGETGIDLQFTVFDTLTVNNGQTTIPLATHWSLASSPSPPSHRASQDSGALFCADIENHFCLSFLWSCGVLLLDFIPILTAAHHHLYVSPYAYIGAEKSIAVIRAFLPSILVLLLNKYKSMNFYKRLRTMSVAWLVLICILQYVKFK